MFVKSPFISMEVILTFFSLHHMDKVFSIENENGELAGVAQLVGCCLAKWKVIGSIPGHMPGLQFQSLVWAHIINISLPFFLPPLPSL